jgi:hypothetical protein
MANEKISVDDLLNSQSKSSFSATVEAVEGQPDLVKVTPWTAAAGCLCHLSVNINKASLAGVTPTGETHVCCGKTLKVVELHFKKGESITLEDVFGQLHRSASKATHEEGSGAASPMYAPGRGPQAIPPVWGWDPPWLTQLLINQLSHHPLWHSRLAPAPGITRASLCESSYSRCLESCQHSIDPWCTCRCRQSNALCLGHPVSECPQ